MGQGGRGPRLAETVTSAGLPGVAEKVGGGADDRLDRPEQEDGQRLREVMCERRSVGICCHDSPHDEAPCPHLRPFHTVSEGEFSEVELPLYGVLRGSHLGSPDLWVKTLEELSNSGRVPERRRSGCHRDLPAR